MYVYISVSQHLIRKATDRKKEGTSNGVCLHQNDSQRESWGEGILYAWKKDGKTIVYSLTERGENALKLAKRKFVKTFFGIFPD